MKRLFWELRRWLDIPDGWLLPIVPAVLFVPLFYLLVIHPAQNEYAIAQRHYAWLTARKAAHPAPATNAGANAGVPVVLQSLPSYRTVPQSLSAIFATAKDLDVMLDIGDYRYHRNRSEMFGRYQIELPLVADYPTVRALVARLMNDMPYAALDDISLIREDVESELVEARLQITLFLSEQ